MATQNRLEQSDLEKSLDIANNFGLMYSRKRNSQNLFPNFIHIIPKSFVVFCKELCNPKRNYRFELRTHQVQYFATGTSKLIQNVPTNLFMSRSQLREQICQTRKSDRQEWQSLVVLNGTKIFLNGTNISFLKFICGILNRGVANSFWNHVIQISSRQMYFQNIYSNLWKVKVFIGNIYSLKSNTYCESFICSTVI
jgi:hypothetical protein